MEIDFKKDSITIDKSNHTYYKIIKLEASISDVCRNCSLEYGGIMCRRINCCGLFRKSADSILLKEIH